MSANKIFGSANGFQLNRFTRKESEFGWSLSSTPTSKALSLCRGEPLGSPEPKCPEMSMHLVDGLKWSTPKIHKEPLTLRREVVLLNRKKKDFYSNETIKNSF